MKQRQEHFLIGFCSLIAVGLMMQLLATALSIHWSDSEIWAVSQSRLLLLRAQEFAFGMKPLFHGLLWVSSAISAPSLPSSVAPMLDGARLVFMINQLTMTLGTLLITRKTGGSALALVVVGFALLANSFFLHQGFRIRSDMLAASFCLFSLLAILSHRKIVAAVLLALAFMATPKTILLWPAFFVFLLAFDRRFFSWKIFGGILSALALMNHQALRDAALFFYREFQIEQLGFSYWDAKRWHYVRIFLKDNPIWAFLLTCAFALLLKPAKLSIAQKALLLFGVFAAFALAVHPEKLPFFIASYVPYFAICIGVAFSRLEAFIAEKTPRMSLAFVLVMLIASGAIATSSAMFIHALSERRSNYPQRTTIADFHAYWSRNPWIRSYDGVGLIVREDLPSFFIGPGQFEVNAGAGEFLRQNSFDMILATDKVRIIGQKNFSFIVENYVDFGGGYYIRSLNFNLEDGAAPPSGSQLLKKLRQEFAGVLSGASSIRFHYFDENMQSVPSLTPEISTADLLNPSFKISAPPETNSLRVTILSAPPVPVRHLSKIFDFDADIGR